jgi:hypothetical protein
MHGNRLRARVELSLCESFWLVISAREYAGTGLSDRFVGKVRWRFCQVYVIPRNGGNL